MNVTAKEFETFLFLTGHEVDDVCESKDGRSFCVTSLGGAEVCMYRKDKLKPDLIREVLGDGKRMQSTIDALRVAGGHSALCANARVLLGNDTCVETCPRSGKVGLA